MKTITVSIVLTLWTLVSLAAESPSSFEIVERAEKIRGPDYPHKVAVSVVDIINGKPTEARTYETSNDLRFGALVKFLKPDADSGKKMLMSGNAMWISFPGSAHPLRISPHQKLIGNAANGDIVGISYLTNYDSTLIRNDKLGNAEVYVLDLHAKKDALVTYERIEYWVERGTYKPLKALFKTTEGMTIREAEYLDFKDTDGTPRPSKIVIKSLLGNKSLTEITFTKIEKVSLSPMLFKKESLTL